ncbi:MAG: class F sortase [Acidothermus sp.]|nr:class F sortase [Acidothermus sp.]
MLPAGRRQLTLTAACAVLAGACCLGIAATSQKTAPKPPAATAQAPVFFPAPSQNSGNDSSSQHDSATSSTPSPSSSGTPTAPPPVNVSIPAIHVSAPIVPLGIQPDGEIQVPSDVRRVGWYELGPAPGALGPAILVGHVDSARSGPGVFFRLGALQPGDSITVDRADGTQVTFTVYAVREYPKDRFPTATVYGPTADPELRLITCGGSFDHASGHYRDNIVVFARTT